MVRRRNVGQENQFNLLNPTSTDSTDGYDPIQFQEPEKKFPLKSVMFIIFFLLIGCFCFTICGLIWIGFFEEKYNDRVLPLFLLGSMVFVPGGYFGWVILNVCIGTKKYTVEDIPIL